MVGQVRCTKGEPMNILFIHQNFPGQFKFLAPALANLGHHVFAMCLHRADFKISPGIELVTYRLPRGTTPNIHPWVGDFETKTIRAEACFKAALKLKATGFQPDVVIAHPGWGESLFVKEVWPKTKLGIYCEFFYQQQGADVGFDPEFPVIDEGDACRLKLKNVNSLLHFEIADAGLSPTKWQASTYPERFRNKISIIHDGIDTNQLKPDSSVKLTITSSTGRKFTLDRNDEVITFVNRNLEPYRGYHTFIRALPALLNQRKTAHVIIVGGEGVSYGTKPDERLHGTKTWSEIFVSEVRSQIPDVDWNRVHFLGSVQYHHFISLLQLSTVHVYLTYPFVLSWSLLEAMSVGCAIVASNTEPLKEVIEQDRTGILVDFFDPKKLASEVCKLLDSPEDRKRLGINAREFAHQNFDLQTICLPAQIAWVNTLARSEAVGAQEEGYGICE